MTILAVTGVTKRFGSLMAVSRVDVRLEPGTIHAIIGPNGAGKTTLFNCATGLHTHDEGSIQFKGRPPEGLKSPQLAMLRVRRPFQDILPFSPITLPENG